MRFLLHDGGPGSLVSGWAGGRKEMLSVARVPQEGLYGLGAVCMSAPHVSGTWSGRKCRAAPWDRGVRCPPQYHLLVKHSCARRRGSEQQRSRDQNSQGDSRGQRPSRLALQGAMSSALRGITWGPAVGVGRQALLGEKVKSPPVGLLERTVCQRREERVWGTESHQAAKGLAFWATV